MVDPFFLSLFPVSSRNFVVNRWMCICLDSISEPVGSFGTSTCPSPRRDSEFVDILHYNLWVRASATLLAVHVRDHVRASQLPLRWSHQTRIVAKIRPFLVTPTHGSARRPWQILEHRADYVVVEMFAVVVGFCGEVLARCTRRWNSHSVMSLLKEYRDVDGCCGVRVWRWQQSTGPG